MNTVEIILTVAVALVIGGAVFLCVRRRRRTSSCCDRCGSCDLCRGGRRGSQNDER
ncbi:MAG: hypothetical protein IJQ80_08415 [Clostridia bacterium]|nr:hypothetical protein [Clostridia bacterium]